MQKNQNCLKKIKIIITICLLFCLSGCSLYWLRGEEHYCKNDNSWFYGYNCPICGGYYLK